MYLLMLLATKAAFAQRAASYCALFLFLCGFHLPSISVGRVLTCALLLASKPDPPIFSMLVGLRTPFFPGRGSSRVTLKSDMPERELTPTIREYNKEIQQDLDEQLPSNLRGRRSGLNELRRKWLEKRACELFRALPEAEQRQRHDDWRNNRNTIARSQKIND